MAKSEAVSVAPIIKNEQWKQKSAWLVRDEAVPPKREWEKETEETVCSAAEQSQEHEEEEIKIINDPPNHLILYRSELRDMQIYFSHQQGSKFSAGYSNAGILGQIVRNQRLGMASSWSPLLRIMPLTKRLGKGQKSSDFGGNPCQVCEGQATLQERAWKFMKQMDNNWGKCSVSERISHGGGDLWQLG